MYFAKNFILIRDRIDYNTLYCLILPRHISDSTGISFIDSDVFNDPLAIAKCGCTNQILLGFDSGTTISNPGLNRT